MYILFNLPIKLNKRLTYISIKSFNNLNNLIVIYMINSSHMNY